MAEYVRVGLRIRPLNPGEEKASSSRLGLQADPDAKQVKLSALINQKVFSFDHVFDDAASQTVVYEEAVEPLCRKILDGWNGCVLAYGQTGSGKTYTMGTGELAVDEDRWGIAPRMLQALFVGIDETKMMTEDQVKVTVSFLEIYNEEVHDLLSGPNSRIPITIRENISGLKLPNLRQVEVSTFEEAMALLKEGVDARTTSSTSMNIFSSRSHAIFSMEMQRKTSEGVLSSKLRMVDLAGSEAVHKTSAQSTTFREGININKSLLALGNMIEALNQDKAYIPYRDSILTRILQESLGGNCCTVLIACVCPTLAHSTETLTTMRFAERIRGIKTKPSMVFSSYGSARKRPLAPATPARSDALKECNFVVPPTPSLNLGESLKQNVQTEMPRRRSPRLCTSPVQALAASPAETEKADTPPRPNDISYLESSNSTLPDTSQNVRKVLRDVQKESLSVTPLIQRVAQRVEDQFTARLEKVASRMEERFREHLMEESFSSRSMFAYHGSSPGTVTKNSTFQQEEFAFKVPPSITVREPQNNSFLCPPTPAVFKRPRCSIMPVYEKENECKCNAFYDDPMGASPQKTSQKWRRRTHAAVLQPAVSVGQIMPSPQRGWKIQVDPMVLERSNHHLLNVLNCGSKAELQTLPCVGPKTAQVIANWREANGSFHNVQSLLHVEGLPKSFYKRFVKANMMSRFDV